MSETETMIGEVTENIETLEIRKFTIDRIRSKVDSVIAIYKTKELKSSSSFATQTKTQSYLDYRKRYPNFRYTHMVKHSVNSNTAVTKQDILEIFRFFNLETV